MATVMRTFVLSEEAGQRLDALAASQGTSPDALIDGLFNPPEHHFTEEQYRAIDEAIAADDAGQHASDEEVRAVFRAFRS